MPTISTTGVSSLQSNRGDGSPGGWGSESLFQDGGFMKLLVAGGLRPNHWLGRTIEVRNEG